MNTKERPPRIAGWEWQKNRPNALAVYNSNYTPSGQRIGAWDKPWTVIGHTAYETFHTHGEAVAFAFREVGPLSSRAIEAARKSLEEFYAPEQS